MMDFIIKKNIRKIVLTSFGFFTLLSVWHYYASSVNPLVVASPYDTIISLFDIFTYKESLESFFITLKRMFLGILIGGSLGFILGIIAGINKDIQNFLEPLRWLFMSISPVIVVIFAMLWFGLGTQMVIFLTIIILSPIIYINTIKGINYIDKGLLEMAEIYKFSLYIKITKIYMPAIIAPLSAAIITVVSNSARVIILAEVLGANEGIGQEISNARSNLEIPELFAWVFISLLIVAILEYLILKPTERYLTRWKRDD